MKVLDSAGFLGDSAFLSWAMKSSYVWPFTRTFQQVTTRDLEKSTRSETCRVGCWWV